MAEKKVTKKAAAPKAAAEKKETVKKAAAPKKAGDVYQALATAEKALTVAEIAKAANIMNEEALLGLGWLLKEGKVADVDGKIALA